MDIKDALQVANDAGLDLVEVAPNADPPVCRVMDYGKYRYEQSKRQKESRKHQHTVTIKEVKMRPKIEKHDYEFKLDHARSFIEHGHKVKVTMMFRGREMAHTDIGMSVILRFVEDLEDIATVEVPPRLEGRNITAMLSGNKSKKK